MIYYLLCKTGSGLRAQSQKVVTSAAVWLPADPCGGGIFSSSAQYFRPTAGQYLSGGVSALRSQCGWLKFCAHAEVWPRRDKEIKPHLNPFSPVGDLGMSLGVKGESQASASVLTE